MHLNKHHDPWCVLQFASGSLLLIYKIFLHTVTYFSLVGPLLFKTEEPLARDKMLLCLSHEQGAPAIPGILFLVDFGSEACSVSWLDSGP